MRIFRIADGRHPVWDGTGALLLGGRWNSPGRPAIYGSLSYACAMLEVLAHAATGRIPRTQGVVVAEVPGAVAVETPAELPPGWDADDSPAAREFGDAWLREQRSAVLVLPSLVARLERNALVNPLHPQAGKLIVSPPEAVIWDKRLFGSHS